MTHDVHLETHTKSSAVRLGIFHPASLPSKGLYVEKECWSYVWPELLPELPLYCWSGEGTGSSWGNRLSPRGSPPGTSSAVCQLQTQRDRSPMGAHPRVTLVSTPPSALGGAGGGSGLHTENQCTQRARSQLYIFL